MRKVCTIREAVQRAKADGMCVSEYSLRAWIRNGKIPVRNVGTKALLFYPNLIRFLQCEDGADNVPISTAEAPGIRRADM